MAISDQLTLLNNTKTAIRGAINAKGGSVEASAPFASYATAIDNLPSGGDDSTLKDLIEGDITSINIPSGTTGIKAGAFQNCTSLTSISIPNTVTSIGDRAFSGCSALQSINIPSNVTRLGTQCFGSCNLTSLTIPDSVTTIPSYLVDHCDNLTKIIVGNNVSTIQDGAFCTSNSNFVLSAIVINTTTVPDLQSTGAFNYTHDCPIYVPSASVDAYKAGYRWSTYAYRIVAIEDAILLTPTNGDPAISVKNYELATANYIQSTDVPSTIKNGAGALEIGGGVTRIGTFTFQNSSSLTSVVIPDTVTRIDEAAFNGCSSLTGITVNATTPPTLYAMAFDSTNNCPIYVPAASVDTYKAASGWSTYASRIVAIPSPSITMTYNMATSPADYGDFEGCEETVVVDSFPADSSSSTFDSDFKEYDAVTVVDNLGNDVTSQCTFSSSDYYKWDPTQDGESEAAYYEWRLDDLVSDGDNHVSQYATITATYGNLTTTFTIEWTKTSNCTEPEPDPEEEPEEE